MAKWPRTSKPVTALAVLGLAATASLGGLLLAGGSASASGGLGAAPNATVEVTGTGTVTGTPDTLTVQLGVQTKAATATAALDQNNAEMATLQSSLTTAGVATKDLQTSNLSLSPNYDSNGNVTGYVVQDDLSATLRDLSSAGAVIDAAAHSVGNDVQIQGISFSISDTSGLLKQAREQAMQDAAAKAANLATGAGAGLGAVVKVTDQENLQSPVPMNFQAMRAAPSAGASAPVPVQAGSQQLSVQVDVVYQLTS